MEKGKPRVLVVDDDIQALECMKAYLKEVAVVSTTLSGPQAIDYVRQNPVDIIFLDVNMPVMNGFMTLEQLRNMKECINVPVVFVTGQNDKYTFMNSTIMGSDGYLIKPVDKEVLQRKTLELYRNKMKTDKQKTILAIDDDMTYLKIISNYLRESYNVIMINSAKLAMNYLKQHTPDLILLDYQMPLYDGVSLMNMINKETNNRTIPVIILSGVIDKEVLLECCSCNPAACLAKPVSKELLIETIERVFNK